MASDSGHVLIACDKFKGSLTAHEVIARLEEGLREGAPGVEVRSVVVADGGDGTLDAAGASMIKMWATDMQCRVVDKCLQLFGGYGYMMEYPIAQMYTASRVQRIYGGTNEIMKLLVARSL